MSNSTELRRMVERQGSRYVRIATLADLGDISDIPAIEVTEAAGDAPDGYEAFCIVGGMLCAGMATLPVFYLSIRNRAHVLDFDRY